MESQAGRGRTAVKVGVAVSLEGFHFMAGRFLGRAHRDGDRQDPLAVISGGLRPGHPPPARAGGPPRNPGEGRRAAAARELLPAASARGVGVLVAGSTAPARGRVGVAERRGRGHRGRSTLGHGVAVLLEVYANGVDGQGEAAHERIAVALDGRTASGTLIPDAVAAPAKHASTAGQSRDTDPHWGG
jgi:hypothetical protein